MHQFCSPQVVSWDKFTCSNSLEPSFDSNSKLFEPPLPILQCSIYIIRYWSYCLIKSKFSLVSILSCPGCRFDFFDDNRDNSGQLFLMLSRLSWLSKLSFYSFDDNRDNLEQLFYLLSLLSLLSKLSFLSLDDNRDNFFICCLANAFPTWKLIFYGRTVANRPR